MTERTRTPFLEPVARDVRGAGPGAPPSSFLAHLDGPGARLRRPAPRRSVGQIGLPDANEMDLRADVPVSRAHPSSAHRRSERPSAEYQDSMPRPGEDPVAAARRVHPSSKPVLHAPRSSGASGGAAAPSRAALPDTALRTMPQHDDALWVAPRPPLVVVAEPDALPRRRQRRVRAFLYFSMAFVAVVLFVAVALHAQLAQNQVTLDGLRDQEIVAERQHQELRLSIAGMVAPGRIVEVATRIGLEVPDAVTYLEPPGEFQPAFGDDVTTATIAFAAGLVSSAKLAPGADAATGDLGK